jgi:hypothetical protein
MPLKADRGLPGELLRAMKDCGWITNSTVPKSPCDSDRSRSASTGLRLTMPANFRTLSTSEPCSARSQPTNFRQRSDSEPWSARSQPANFRPWSTSEPCSARPRGFFECMESALESIPSDARVAGPHSSPETAFFPDLQPRSKARSQEDGSILDGNMARSLSPGTGGQSVTEEPIPLAPPRTQLAKCGHFATDYDCTWGPVWL